MRTRSGIGVKTATASHGERETGGRLPDFVIVGSMKSGTTSLFQYLGLHPGVGLPARKELDFFVAHRNWRRGEGWYRSQFAPVADGLVTGESSPNYTMRHLFPGVAERMAAVVPDARLLYVVRDPVARVRSHYVHEVAAGRERRAIDEAVTDDLDANKYLLTSRYFWQLGEFTAHFPRSQIRVVSFERLTSDPASTVGDVLHFLGLEGDIRDGRLGEVHNESSTKRRPTALGWRLGRKGRAALARVAPRLVWAPLDRLSLSASSANLLREALRDDSDRLRDFAGDDFPEWSV